MTEKPITAKDIEEAFGKVDFEKLIGDDILKEGAEEFQRQYDKHLMTILYGSSFANYVMKKQYKKIKRKLSYDVYYWSNEGYRVSKYFESSKKARNYVNYIHNSGLMKDGDYVRMEKTWCYREHSPRHKWYYISEDPNHFVCVEKY
jgi:hypothetical protein